MNEEPTSQPSSLRYQEHRGLNEVTGYATGLQLVMPQGGRVYLALSATELAIYFEGHAALHYDFEGRLVKVVDGPQFWRRSLSGQVLHSRKLTAEEGGGLYRKVVTADQAHVIYGDAQHATAGIAGCLRDGTGKLELGRPSVEEAYRRVLPALERAAGFDGTESLQQADRFATIYGRVAVLPPDQYNALVLQVTAGCAYAGCTFCELYRGLGFRRKSLDEFRQHITNAVQFHGESLRARRSIFLGEANALTQPASVLRDFFRLINEQFELPAPETPSAGIPASWWLGSKTRFDGVSTFMDAFTNPNRTVADYFELRRLGLRRVYIGLETGAADLLKWLRKPATPDAVRRCVQMLHETDIIVGVIVLLGAGGREYSAQHVRETIRVLNELPLGRSDFIYFSPLVVYPGSQYDTQSMADQVTPLTPEEMHRQEDDIRLGLRFDARRGKPHLARYEIETFVY